MNRPFAITIAAIVTLLHSLYSIVFTIPLLARGASAAAEATDSPPYFILVLGLVFGVLGLVATWGLWNN